jgi:hypothetical protein
MFNHCLEEDTGVVTNKYVMHDFGLLLHCKWDLRSSGTLWSIDSVLCNIPELWRSQILYACHKFGNGNWWTSTCFILRIYSNMHNIIVSIKGNMWLTSLCREWKLFFWNMVQFLSIIPCFPASLSALLWSLKIAHIKNVNYIGCIIPWSVIYESFRVLFLEPQYSWCDHFQEKIIKNNEIFWKIQ